jgi:hypothetical protein
LLVSLKMYLMRILRIQCVRMYRGTENSRVFVCTAFHFLPLLAAAFPCLLLEHSFGALFGFVSYTSSHSRGGRSCTLYFSSQKLPRHQDPRSSPLDANLTSVFGRVDKHPTHSDSSYRSDRKLASSILSRSADVLDL